jgi:AcrR family transcriptional regulator
MANIESKKLKKRLNLIDAAQRLFMNEGFANTSIDDIVKNANVAKGTFYLYFHDKFDILRVVALNVSCKVLDEAYAHMMGNRGKTLAENVVLIADYIIEYFRKNPLVLKLVERNFSWPLVREQLSEEQDNQLKRLMDECAWTRRCRGARARTCSSCCSS